MSNHPSAPAATSAPGLRPGPGMPGVPAAQLSLAELGELERNALPDELVRYLAAVDEYRREGCVLAWLSEDEEVH